jgi:amino acid transporter
MPDEIRVNRSPPRARDGNGATPDGRVREGRASQAEAVPVRTRIRRRLFSSEDGSLFRVLFGRRLKTAETESQQVGPLQGVPILGLDALGSSSYGPEAALAILIPVGAAGLWYMREVVLAILILLGILFFSYRQTIAAYPSGGGSYSVARENLGKGAGLCAAAALLLDYILNVAVGISAGVGALESAFPPLQAHTLALCLGVLALVTLVNLRGVRDSGLAWTLPTYAFVASLSLVLAIGVWKAVQSGGHPAPVQAPPPLAVAAAPVTLWLILRAFASGCTAMTGVEAVSNAVPIFAEPRIKNARRTLLMICLILAVLLGGIGYLAQAYSIGARVQTEPGYESVVSQLVSAIVGRGPLYYVTIGSLLAVLTLSANTSFAGFPRICRILAEDSYLPSAFATLGRRLVYTLGIIVLTLCSATLLIVFGGITDHLIPLFAVGAFGAFTFSQAGMVVHWRRLGHSYRSPSLLINALGTVTTAAALVVIVVAKFTEGAWITVLIIPALIAIFHGVRRHYAKLKREIRPPLALQTWKIRPLKVIIPIDGWTRVSERALRIAMRFSSDITAVHVTDEESDEALVETWRTRIEEPARRAGWPEPRLEVIHSPYRQLFKPLLDYVDRVAIEDPDCLIALVIPELVEPRWWEYLLHNNIAATLKAVLLLRGDERVVVLNTPWFLHER